MAYYPFRKLFLGEAFALTVAGNRFQVHSVETGKLLQSIQACEGPISAIDVFWDTRRVVSTGDDKLLRVWIMSDEDQSINVCLESSRTLRKKSSELHFTVDGQNVLVSDKFGDIYLYSTVKEDQSGSLKERLEEDGEQPSGQLLLGHTSVITCFTLDYCNKFIISGDRDEHIRVSWYPQGYVIDKFCLGHRKYLSALHIPPSSQSTLISGGGDPDLIVWDWTTGMLVQKIPILDAVKPFVKVTGGRRNFVRRPRLPDGEGLSRKSKRPKKKPDAQSRPEVTKDQDIGSSDEGEPEVQTGEFDVERKAPDSTLLKMFDPNAESLVVGQIASIRLDHSTLVLFTVIGASALFYCKMPGVLEDIGGEPSIHSVDLQQPVLNFVVPTFRPTEVWVIIDTTWNSNTENTLPSNSCIHLLVCSDGELKIQHNHPSPLLNGVNASRVFAQDGYNTLELYSALAWLPKSSEEEADDNGEEPEPDRNDLLEEEIDPAEVKRGPGNRKSIKKLQGRLKTRQQLMSIKETEVPKDEDSAEQGG